MDFIVIFYRVQLPRIVDVGTKLSIIIVLGKDVSIYII